MNLRAQTASEYMMILSFVLIIGLIVLVALGGLPGIGSGTSSNANTAYWTSTPVGIEG